MSPVFEFSSDETASEFWYDYYSRKDYDPYYDDFID